MDSPRGRIYQMVQVERGRMPLEESFVRHMDLCLGCLACETACPSGVEYHKLVESARGQIERFYKRSPLASLARRLFLRELLPHRRRLILLGTLLRWVQQLGLKSWRWGSRSDSADDSIMFPGCRPAWSRPSSFNVLGR